MQYPIFFFVFLAFFSGNPAAKERAESKPLTDSVNCQNGLMPIPRYVYTPDNTFSPLTDQRKDFIIAVDKSCKPTNNGQHIVRFINNTTDTVVLKTQDGSFMAVMQGLTKSGRWCAIQFWHFKKWAEVTVI